MTLIDPPGGSVAPHLMIVDPRRVKFSDYNPKNRTEEVKLKILMRSMVDLGQISPITITARKLVIDGHRRVSAAKLLGWKYLWAIVWERDLDPAEVYASVNASSRRMSGNDMLGSWLTHKRSVTPRMAALFTAMQESLGIALVNEIYQLGLTLSIYTRALQVGNYVDNLTNPFVRKTTRWLIDQWMSTTVRKLMAEGIPASTIVKAINKNEPLSMDNS